MNDGQKVQVRRLGLFEIDDIPKDIPGPYTYTVHLLGGDDYEMTYDIEAALETPPEKPSIPLEEAIAGEPEYYGWQNWLRHQEALEHQTKVYEAYAEYCERVAVYVRENCLDEGLGIETPEDWDLIYNAALCPQVTMEDIQGAMTHTFGARWAGKELFDALANVEGSLGEYISTKVWESDLMIKLGETDEIFAERSIKSRARMIAALKIPQFFSILESDRSLKEAKAKAT
ncbi:MAG: hypothetical protein V3S14_03180 [Anaerolineae bacterium]